MVQVLLIDDDTELCELLRKYLEPEGFAVTAVHTAPDGEREALTGRFAMAIVDVMLPGGSGFDVVKRVRSQSKLPMLMLTARGDEVDRIVGLEIGADDYLPKPFNARELLARVRAILRRSDATKDPGKPIQVGDVELDPGSRSVRVSGESVDVTDAEFDILAMLLASAGSVVSRDQLAEHALGRKVTPFDRSIDVHISSLRKKLGAQVNDTERIKSVRGSGYLYSRPGT